MALYTFLSGHTCTVNTLANANTTVVHKAGGTNSANAFCPSVPSGTWYWELVWQAISSQCSMGLALPTTSINAGHQIGDSTDSLGLQPQAATNGNVVYNNVNPYQTLPGLTFTALTAANGIVCIAYDAGLGLIWWRFGSGNWNGNAGADPASSAGGVILPAPLLTAHSPVVGISTRSANDWVNGLFLSTSWNFSAPAGFIQLPSSPDADTGGGVFGGARGIIVPNVS